MRVHRIACALALAVAAAFPATGRAQEPTAADKAFYTEFVKVCAPQIDAMKKFLASKNEPMTDNDLRGFMEPMPAALREAARSENITMVTALRKVRADFIKEANDPNSTDPSNKVLEPTMTCFLDLLIAKQSAPAANPPSAPAPATPAPNPTGQILGCLSLDESPEGFTGFRNKCDFALNFSFCASKPKKGAPVEGYSCDGGRVIPQTVAARALQRPPVVLDAETVYWFACRFPQVPTHAKFDGTDIVGVCR